MITITKKMPSYGMPIAEGPGNRPEQMRMGPPPGDDGPGGPGGMPTGMQSMPEGMEAMPEGMMGGGKVKASPPTTDPRSHPGIVPGSDIPPGTPGPGFPGGGPPKAPPFDRVESIDIIDGKYIPCDEPYAEITGEITDTGINGLKYVTDTPCLNGIYIGNSDYTIENCEFDLKGDGIDDFAGIGSAIMVAGKSDVTVKDTVVKTEGVIRPCTTAVGDSVVKFRNCVLDSVGAEIPDSYVPRIGSGMMTPPPGLEIGGNCRTHLSMGNSKCYFYDSKIYADSWAALSTDSSSGDLYLEANNCDVLCRDIGYGTYADNGCHNVLNDCRVEVATHAAIIAGESSVAFNDCEVKSGEIGTMVHCVRGSGSEVSRVDVRGGRHKIGDALMLVKSCNVYMKIDGVVLEDAEYILHAIVNKDEAAKKAGDDRLQLYGYKAYISNALLSGDIVNDDPDREMSVVLENVKLSGRINEAFVTITGSEWTATADSSVCLVGEFDAGAIDAGVIDALLGVTITAKAGEGCNLSGEYKLASGGVLSIDNC